MRELLNTIPDGSNWNDLERWLADCLHAIDHSVARSAIDFVCIEGAEIASLCAPSPFGKIATDAFRRFAAGIFCADLACYTTAADQVNFERLFFVMHGFCEGFRLFGLRDAAGTLLPVGYTGFYPISEASFTQLERADSELANRLIAPLSALPKDQHFLYLFNYSIAAPLRGTDCSRRLMHKLAADIKQRAPRGLATITVSADGVRIAERFGMQRTGSLQLAQLTESVLTARF